ncbi:MAG: hypothetical protein ACTS85_02125 [Arsenophonus sp. NC-PG7-MAG3]
MSTLSKRYGISELTVVKERKQDDVDDCNYIPHRLPMMLSPNSQ